MMRSLFSGVAGLKTHQTKMDVIGNNIANVNTVGYKSASVTFQELMYQTTQSASGANAETGRAGVNAKQIGLGVSTGAITNNVTTSGASQSTGNPFDIQITGDSFFIVSDGSNNYFTRAGAFYVDGAGNLAMTSNGYTVMGWQEDESQPGTIKKDTVSKLQIMSAENMTSEPEQTTKAYLSGIIDKNSTQLTSTDGLIVNIPVYDNLGYSYIIKASIKSTGTEGYFSITPTEILDSAGNKLVAGLDGDGNDVSASLGGLSTFKLGNTTISYSTSTDATTGKTVGTYTTTGTTYLNYDTSTGEFKGITGAVGTAATDPDEPLSFNATSGPLATAFVKTTDVVDGKGGNNVDIALDTTTMYDNNKTSTIAGTAGDYDGNYAGRKVGTMSGVSIQTDGKIYASYNNGTTKLLGQIAVASFANPSGLEKVGENLYSATLNSGTFDGIGQDVTADSGSMSTGVLEMSNVDLSSEFTEMITTQRGFQANSRIITVSDSMLEELTNLKR